MTFSRERCSSSPEAQRKLASAWRLRAHSVALGIVRTATLIWPASSLARGGLAELAEPPKEISHLRRNCQRNRNGTRRNFRVLKRSGHRRRDSGRITLELNRKRPGRMRPQGEISPGAGPVRIES